MRSKPRLSGTSPPGCQAKAFCLVLALGSSAQASAHAWGNTYSLPIPFAMYAYGAAAALVLSFVLVGYFTQAEEAGAPARSLSGGRAESTTQPVSAWVLAFGRTVSVLGLGLTVITGLCGNPSPFANFSMNFFWVIFVLGFTYLTGLVGDIYSLINPWRALCEALPGKRSISFVARIEYPQSAGYWPAIVLYGAFVWIELFLNTGPRALALALTAYSGITMLGAWIYGPDKWFQYGEFFGVFLRLIAGLAPIEWVVSPNGARFRIRRPLQALAHAAADHPTLVLFILFILSSTAFDGIHETLPWVNVFWRYVFPHMVPLITQLGVKPFDVAASLYYDWQYTMLVLSPFAYYGVYLVVLSVTKLATRSGLSAGELACRFALSLLPIAFVYHVSHYFALLLTEGPNIAARISDPFGFGWDLFGTAHRDFSFIPPAAAVWHAQVWLILAGHIVSVYIAHKQALVLFRTRALALRSQWPMLLLMVTLTTFGLWILSLPIAAGQVNSSFAVG